MTAAARADWRALALAARNAPEEPEAGALREYLRFELAGSSFALPIAAVAEVARLAPIARVPHARADLLGILSLRGRMLRVFDLRVRLSLPAPAPTASGRIAILRDSLAHPVGVWVDRVRDVLRIAHADQRPAARGAHPAIHGLLPTGESFVSLLDPEQLLGEWRAARANE